MAEAGVHVLETINYIMFIARKGLWLRIKFS